ncbi:MAG: 50S ribosomal protein L18 [Candidatus Omnitrophica bacterium]|nr:50S ribosomal protein L18 [Candidatus Omnitrophota bacterium]
MGRFIKLTGRSKRQKIIRGKIAGTGERPRLSVYRSLNHMYAQIIDDSAGKTLVALSTSSPELKESLKKNCGNVKAATLLGAKVAELCKKTNIVKVVFDRSGYRYHGRVKALADAARKGGLQF